MFLKPKWNKAVGANTDHKGKLEGPEVISGGCCLLCTTVSPGEDFWRPSSRTDDQMGGSLTSATLATVEVTVQYTPTPAPGSSSSFRTNTKDWENLNGRLNHYYSIWIVVTSLDPSPLMWKVEGQIKQCIRHCPVLTIWCISSVFFKETIFQSCFPHSSSN